MKVQNRVLYTVPLLLIVVASVVIVVQWCEQGALCGAQHISIELAGLGDRLRLPACLPVSLVSCEFSCGFSCESLFAPCILICVRPPTAAAERRRHSSECYTFISETQHFMLLCPLSSWPARKSSFGTAPPENTIAVIICLLVLFEYFKTKQSPHSQVLLSRRSPGLLLCTPVSCPRNVLLMPLLLLQPPPPLMFFAFSGAIIKWKSFTKQSWTQPQQP